MKKIFTVLFILSSFLSYSQSTTVVISQVYGGGGGSTGTYLFDYVELHNISGTTQSIAGFSIQYGSATGNFGSAATNVYAFPAGTSMPAGSYLLIQCGATGSGGVALPVPADIVTGNLTMSAASGKVVLSNQAAALGCGATATTCTLPSASIIDLVSYGAGNNAEGGVSVNNGVALVNTQGAVRKNNGCTETDNNNADFNVVTAPVPHNSASPIFACGAIAPSLTVTGTIADFGNVFIGSSSASQSYNLSGANLTGAPGNITVTAPSTDFQVSNDNTIWGASTTIAYATSTLAATAVWVRFSPQSAGFKSGNVSNVGGGVTVSVDVPVSGTGVTPPTPVFSASSLNAFGNVCVNATAGPNDFTISGVNLTTADVTVGPLAGYSFSTTAAGSYSASLTLPQPGGSFSQQVFVNFTPVANQSYNGNIDVAGGGAPTISVAASGAGANNPPAITTGAASSITITTATLAGTITDIGCSAISAYGVEYSLTAGFPNGTGTSVASSNLSGGGFTSALTGLTASTTYYYHAYATNAGGTTYGAEQSFTTATPVLTATALTAFGANCINTTTAANTFTINSTGLGTANVTVGPLTGYSFSTTAAGTYTPSLSLAQPGGPYTQAIYVKFNPLAVQSYNGNIPVGGGAANTINVPVSGSGANLPAVVQTGAATIISSNAATAAGTITGIGCSVVTEYGIIYSGISGFANGGTRVAGSNLAGADFSVTMNSLVQGTTYYYKAYVTNNAGTAYGAEDNFTTPSIPDGLVVYSSPIVRGGNVHFTLNNVKPGHYQAKVFNSVGQLVYQKEMILQVNFIDDNFTLPANIRTGLYTLQVYNHEFKVNKQFMVQ
ncbi:MAG: lamin tail domain-containing protein [Ferruginibacter sp.]